MDNDQIGPVAQRRRVGIGREGQRGQFWIGGPVGRQPRFAMIGQQVPQAPRALRLEDADLMAEDDQLPQDATQEVGVAVVPAGRQRMGEIDDLHATASLRKGVEV